MCERPAREEGGEEEFGFGDGALPVRSACG